MKLATIVYFIFFAILMLEADNKRTPKMTYKQMESDLLQLYEALEHHWSYYEQKKSLVHKVMVRAIMSLDKVKNQYEFVNLLQKTIASLGDGHCSVYGRYMQPEVLLPFHIQKTREGIVVDRLLSSSCKIKVGERLVKINDRDMEMVIRQKMAYINASTSHHRRAKAVDSCFYQHFLFQSGKAFCEITVESIEGEMRKVKIFELKQYSPASLNWMQWKDLAPNIGYLRVRSFQVKNAKKSYREIDRAFRAIGHKKTIIIDMRGNDGGSDHPAKYIARYLIKAPFVYSKIQVRFSRGYLNIMESPNRKSQGTIVKFGDWLKPRLHKVFPVPNIKRSQARIVVIIDGTCFSSTDNFVACLRDLHPQVKFVGRSTGGGSGWGLKLLTLKYSKIHIHASTLRDWSPKGRQIEGNSTVPDYKVEWLREDIVKAKDPDLKMALQLAQQENWK